MGEQERRFPFISRNVPGADHEDLYEVTDKKWKQGAKMGTTTITASADGSVLGVRFDITEEPTGFATLEPTDAVELDGGQVRKGRFRITDVKGIAVDPSSEIYLNVRNPKRWGTDDSP